MLSRVADSIYWMSRYVERAENVARFVDVNLKLMLDLSVAFGEQWHPLVETTGDASQFAQRYARADKDAVVRFLTCDPANPNSILSCLRSARENARSIREIISSEMWQELNTFYLDVKKAVNGNGDLTQELGDFLEFVRYSSHMFTGVTDNTMNHGEAWHFCHMGRMLERADKTTRILDVKYYILLPSVADVGTSFDDIQWAAVLRSASAFEMYRKRHGRIAPSRVVEFLLVDKNFPRSVRFCLDATRASLHAITGTPLIMFRSPTEQLVGQLCSEFAYVQVDDIIHHGLHEYLDALQSRMNEIGAGIQESFFAPKLHSPGQRPQPGLGIMQSANGAPQ
jgi:uncharacterized alpha-E superfamily protein